MEHEKSNGKVSRVKTIPFWKGSLVMLSFDIPLKNVLFSKDVLSVPTNPISPKDLLTVYYNSCFTHKTLP